MTETVRVRFAPSPTGNPHVGNFRTALYNYLFARRHRGQFLLRIEDTDKERSKPEYVEAIIDSLRWLGMEPDEAPVYQSRQLERHKQAAQRLLAEGHAYRCRCTPDELAARREEQIRQGKTPMYDGRCRVQNYPDDGTPHCLRLKTPHEGSSTVDDPIRGAVTVENREIDDLILLRTDGSPTYNFAVVIDDHDMAVTHVIRGDDHLNNTIRQVAIYQMLGFELPRFYHLPQILGPDKTRLSKRHGAAGVLEYREQGYLPEGLMNYLARLGWGHGDREIFTPDELVEFFSLDNINKSSAVFDPQKLLWVNAEHIRAKPLDALTDAFIEYLVGKGYQDGTFCHDPGNRELFRKMVACTQERSQTLEEMYQRLAFFFHEPIEYEPGSAEKAFKGQVTEALQALLDYAQSQTHEPGKEEWEQAIQSILQSKGFKMKVLGMAARIAATGTKASPPLADVFAILGRERLIKRLQDAIAYAQGVGLSGDW